MDFSIHKYIVLGLGISGKSCAEYLLSQRYSVLGLDRNYHALKDDPKIQQLCQEGLVFQEENDCFDLKLLQSYTHLIVSPGIVLSHRIIKEAVKVGLKVLGEAEFAFSHIQNRAVAITGSNGKTTTTLLVCHVLNAEKIQAKALGNIGVCLSSYLLNQDPKDILVVELSSFQLESFSLRCFEMGVILNIFPNHLDRYVSMQEYADAKIHLANCMNKKENFWVSSQVMQNFRTDAKVIEESSDWESNTSAAFAICQHFGITKEIFAAHLKTFCRPKHRLEEVLEIDGVRFINDSKSSNVESVIYAVKQFVKPIILIVGGKDKGSSYKPWIECFQGKVKHVIAYGQARDKINQDIGSSVCVMQVGPFEEAFSLAVKLGQKEDIVLLSPGCSSYDQFRNFEHRGNIFKELVAKRKDGEKKNNFDCCDH